MLRIHRIQFLNALSARARHLEATTVQDQPPRIHGDARLTIPLHSVEPRSIIMRGDNDVCEPFKDDICEGLTPDQIESLSPEKKVDLAETLFDNGTLTDICTWYEKQWAFFQRVDEAVIAEQRVLG